MWGKFYRLVGGGGGVIKKKKKKNNQQKKKTLRFPSAKHSDEPLKAGIVFSKGFHDSWVSSPLPRREPEYIYLEIRLFNGIE